MLAVHKGDVQVSIDGKYMKPSGTLADLLNATTLDRVTPLREQLYQLIRRAIVAGQLEPGAAINEVDIAEQLGISRTPVREAVKKISDEGLVEILAQSGTYVASISREQVDEAYIIRTALELESIARAAAVITPQQVHALEDIVEAHGKTLERHQYAEAIARDDDFHRFIAEVNGLSTLWKAVDISKAQMDRCRHLTISAPGNGKKTIAEHRAIVRGLKLGDRRAAVAAMKAHLESSLRNTDKYLDAQAEQRALSDGKRRRTPRKGAV